MEIDDARDAEDLVDSYYRDNNPLGPHPYDFETHKQGYTWIVRYRTQTILGVEDHEMRINAHTGNVMRNF